MQDKSIRLTRETWVELRTMCIDNETSADEEVAFLIAFYKRILKEDEAKRVCRTI